MADVSLKDASGHVMKLVDFGGCRMCTMDREPEEQAQLARNVKRLQIRDDDVFLLTPVKSGTHWTWEIASMLINGKAENIGKSKSQHMLENETAEYIDGIRPYPRVLNSHLPIRCLPEQLFEKQCKIIFVVRHPKDMAVSWYHHVRGIRAYKYDGKWEDFLPLLLAGELEYGSWFEYIKSWEQFINTHPSHPVHVLTYEQLHKDNTGEIKKLAAFLNVDADDEFVASISNKCSFQNMRSAKHCPLEIEEKVFQGGFTMYRKGIVGDWKNVFTVAQSEEFDRVYRREMANCKLLPNYI